MRVKSLFPAIILTVLLVAGLGRKGRADEGAIFIDPSDPTLIRRTVIPFQSEILLRATELPMNSEAHPKVLFGEQRFSYVKLSPDGATLAFSVDGSLSDWNGLFRISDRSIRQVGLSFDAVALTPHWSPDGKRVAFEEEDPSGRRYLQVYGLDSEANCSLDGRMAKGRYLDFLNPWWDEAGEKIYFRVEVNNNYRRSMGLKPLSLPSRIGEAGLSCQNLVLRSVEKFMAEVPAKSIPQEAMALFPKSPL
ncbi:MAG: hypothetical protein U1F66_13255 [bacterium]